MGEINFLNWAWRCLLVIICVVPIGVLMRIFTSKFLLERPVDWIKEGKTILKEIFKANSVVGVIFLIEGISTNLAMIFGIIFLILGLIFN